MIEISVIYTDEFTLCRGPETRKRAARMSKKIASFGGIQGALYAYQNAAKWKRVGNSRHLRCVRYDGVILFD